MAISNRGRSNTEWRIGGLETRRELDGNMGQFCSSHQVRRPGYWKECLPVYVHTTIQASFTSHSSPLVNTVRGVVNKASIPDTSKAWDSL